ncbi:MAG: FAD:protein FMN transferase [Eubacteriales bacterium]
MEKKNIRVILCICLVLGLLAVLAAGILEALQDGSDQGPLTSENYTLFDTVSYIYSYRGDTEEAFGEICEEVWSLLEDYHCLFDIYHEYSGVVNLCTLNKNAGGEALEVSPKLIEFLLYAKELCVLTDGEMNIMMGAVLSPWHDAREDGTYIPSDEVLGEAGKHISIDSLVIDEENNTVRIADANARIDVGALGKGYATEKAAQLLESKGIGHYVLNIGGNIRIIGTKVDGTGWKTGIKNPSDTGTFAEIVYIADTSCVTSGDYERYFTVGGKKYHHIIDKDTLMPAEYFSAITVITKDSALADALSTALFCMSYEDGLALLGKIENELGAKVDVLWIYPDGVKKMTDGFASLLAE